MICLLSIQLDFYFTAISRVYTRYGKCYTFNGNKTTSRKTKQGGMGNGLEIMLDIQQDEYLPIWRETKDETSLEAGIRVQIHSQDEPPYIHQLGFGVSPGFQTFVSCQEQRLTYLPQPWGNCRSTSKEKFPGYDTYSISACRLLCETNEVLRVCKCRMVHMPDLCKALEHKDHLTCCFVVVVFFQIIFVVNYETAQVYLSFIPFTLSLFFPRDNFLVLDIFFEALNYETIEQKKAYDVAGLLGKICMGLFIGASILTVLEILDYIYEVIKHRLQRLLRPQKEEKKNKQQTSTVATVGLEEMKAKVQHTLNCNK
uniref:Acid-sensing (proton-gated) ion channel family member 4b n=1 Tax=Acanthochromis polyacanthus TaxID=80966 RepID=A0A3Q1EM70_9TELE